MKSKNIYNLNIILISTILVLSKYIISYTLNYEEDLFFKIIRLADKDFETYALITKSLSQLNLKTDFSNILVSEKIIGFPFLSLIWHSIFFNFFSYYSFIILEIIFYFLITFLLFKLFYLIQKKYINALFSLILLLFGIELLTFLSNSNIFGLSINYFFFTLLLPLNEFFGQRFPHPLITSVYLFTFIYVVGKINKTNDVLINSKYAYWLGVCSIFLINSFFFHFVKASIFLFIFLIFKYKFLFFKMLRKNLYSLTIYLFLLSTGFTILLLQLHLAEDDYSTRLGIYEININDKILILKVLIKKLFQFEILIIIFLSFFARYNYKKIGIKGNDIINYDLFFTFFLASLLSPYLFIIFTNKFTHLYYFWSAIKFSGFLFIFTILIKIFLNIKFKINIKILSTLLIVSMFLLSFYNNFSKQKKADYQLINDRNEIRLFLNKKEYKNTDKSLFSDDYAIIHLWLKLKNKYLIILDGFVSSYSDELLENIKFNYLKMINVSELDFKNMLTENENLEYKRNNFASTFGYKYSLNSIRNKKPINLEYSLIMQKKIKEISPLIQWHHFFSNSEKERLLNKYKNFKLDKNLIPNLIILKNDSVNKNIKLSLKELNYIEVFSNKSFTINELNSN